MAESNRVLIGSIRKSAFPLHGGPDDFNALLSLIGNARFVLIGEASHGTHEFYRIRSEITKRLIREAGFRAVAVEADWPDAYRINRFVQGVPGDADATESLGGFERFPQWMWRNADVLDFTGWLRAFNDNLDSNVARVGFYGLDLYSMHASIRAVLEYLRTVDENAASRALSRYSCFDHFGADPQEYGYAAALGLSNTCEAETVEQLVELQRSAAEYAKLDGRLRPDDTFFAEQNARLVRNAERYYRSMFDSRQSSWNLRDRHMAEMLGELLAFLDQGGTAPAKIVVWAHNSHLGDARATQMGEQGELNLGQLVRERWKQQSVHIGFTTFDGTVTAASDWGGSAERMLVRPALQGSYEALFHETGLRNFMLDLSTPSSLTKALMTPRLERAIGVIYRPRTERISHYFQACLPRQFDAILHYDHTRAVEPLERTAQWDMSELPETYPSAL